METTNMKLCFETPRNFTKIVILYQTKLQSYKFGVEVEGKRPKTPKLQN